MDHAGMGLDRLALPPGDGVAWAVLVAGTLLDGVRWPGFGTLGWDCPVAERVEVRR